MAFYVHTDIETTDDGDLVIDEIGDISVASPLKTATQAINNIILTNKGELLTDTSFGANLQQFYGNRNSREARALMERQIEAEVQRQALLDLADVSVDVVAIDVSDAAIIVNVRGAFVDTTTGNLGGIVQPDDGIEMGYLYPFASHTITKISDSDLLDATNF